MHPKTHAVIPSPMETEKEAAPVLYPIPTQDNFGELQRCNSEYDFNEFAEKVAAERGLVVVYPEPHQLQLDLDSDEAYIVARRAIAEFHEEGLINVIAYKETVSASGLPHRHITLDLFENLNDDFHRIALQCALGSDPKREKLNMKRLLAGCQQPTRLFEVPVSAVTEEK